MSLYIMNISESIHILTLLTPNGLSNSFQSSISIDNAPPGIPPASSIPLYSIRLVWSLL